MEGGIPSQEVGDVPSKDGLTFKVLANGVETDVTNDVELVEPEAWTEVGEQYATWKYEDETHGEVISWSVEYTITEPSEG